jgi:DNA-binding NarL/FixJ family response regulator
VIRALVADDQEVVRAGFSALLDTQSDITVVASAANGAEAVALSAEHGPDVVLMDVRMPVMDGIEATRQICAAGDVAPRILTLTTFDLDEYVYDLCTPVQAGFCSRTFRPRRCSRRYGSSQRETHSSRPSSRVA